MERENGKKISRNKQFPVCVGTRLMMFVWSVKHLHDMELNYCLSNPETGLKLNLLITELVLLDPRTLSVTSFEQFETLAENFSILLSNLLKKISIQEFYDTETTTARRKQKNKTLVDRK